MEFWVCWIKNYWAYETVILAHLVLSRFLILSSQWYWYYSDLDLFISSSTGDLVLDLSRIFGVHLLLASATCFCYGALHLSGLLGPGFWTSDAYGVMGSSRGVKSAYFLSSLVTGSYGVITAHHVSAGTLGVLVSVWHISSRPQPSLYSILSLGNLEVVLSSSISSVFFIGFITSSTMWYGATTTPIELFGPSRYQWDNAYFAIDIGSRVNSNRLGLGEGWFQVPDKLTLYDYVGCNPAKGYGEGRPYV